MSKAERKLLEYFLDQLRDNMGSSGCNDMDQSVFSGMTPEERAALKAAYDEWDRRANPQDYEVARFEWIADYGWLGFLRDRLEPK